MKCLCTLVLCVRLLGKAMAISNNKIHVGISIGDFGVWLINGTDADVPMRCGELFGFGTGTAAEVPTGILSPKTMGSIFHRSHFQ